MTQWLKQSTAFTFRIGPFVDDTDGKTAETGLTIAQADIQISKAGGAFAQTSASPTTTHDADGWYQCPLTTTDTSTLGTLDVQVAISGALPVWAHFMVVPANVFDSWFSTDYLQVETVAHSTAAKAEIEAEVDDALGGGTGTALSAIPWNAAWDAEVQSECTDALNAYDPPTDTEMDAAFLALIGADSDTLETLSDQLDAVATSVAITAQSAGTTAGELPIIVGVTASGTFSGLTIPATWTKIWLTIKNEKGDADTSAVIQVLKSNPGVGTDGLLYLNGAAGTAAYASLTVDQAAGTVAYVIADEATIALSKATIGYDLKCLASTGVTTRLTSGTAPITLTETRAIA